MSPVYAPSTVARHVALATSRSAVDEVDGSERSTRTLALLRHARQAGPTERQRLHDEVVLLHLDVAESIVSRYRNRGVATDDLVQVASVGLVKAAQRFDPHKSENFLGYAVPTILGEVKRHFRDHAWVVKPPRRIQELQAEISVASSGLSQLSGRAPTVPELARVLDIDVPEIVEAQAVDGCFSPTSLDRPSRPDDDAAPSLGDLIGDDDTGFARAEAVAALRPACRQLSARDRRIIYLRFFHDWTQARIAEEFGVTQMQVSRLLTRILGQLRAHIGDTDPAIPA